MEPDPGLSPPSPRPVFRCFLSSRDVALLIGLIEDFEWGGQRGLPGVKTQQAA